MQVKQNGGATDWLDGRTTNGTTNLGTEAQGPGTDGLGCSHGGLVRSCHQETLVQQCNDKRLGEFAVRHRSGL